MDGLHIYMLIKQVIDFSGQSFIKYKEREFVFYGSNKHTHTDKHIY